MPFRSIFAILMLLMCTACQPGLVVKSDPQVSRLYKAEYDIAMMPGHCTRDQFKIAEYTGCHYFVLEIRNKTDSNIEVDWNRTMYLANGQTAGTFMFSGISYINKEGPKPPDTVFPGQSLQKRIYPVGLAFWSTLEKGWYNDDMPEGVHGVYLSMNLKGVERRERLETRISIQRAQ